MSTMRERFEAWAHEKQLPMNIRYGGYILTETARAWDAWQAAEASRDAEIAALKKRLEVDPRAPAYDGIACRDITIRELERDIEALQAKIQDMALQALTAEAQHDDELGKYMAHHDALMAAAEQAQELLRMFVTHQCVTSDRFVAVLQKLDSAIYAVRHST
jgi:DNA repair exonuclease SbcCD ATPase subunit